MKKQPGIEAVMKKKPVFDDKKYRPALKLRGKRAVITGGDSGIGRAVAVAFAKEGADVAIVYLNEHIDATKTREYIEQLGRKAILISGDLGEERFAKEVARVAKEKLGGIDILVNNAAEQHPQDSILKITSEQLESTFRTNIFSIFYLTKACLSQMKNGSVIINTSSVTAYRGSHHLIDYASTKGAVIAFTRSLSKSLIDRQIRVNAVAPGPIWTPLIPSTFKAKDVEKFGQKTPMKRMGQPEEIAPSYVFLASDDSSYITGQVLHPNGGEAVNG